MYEVGTRDFGDITLQSAANKGIGVIGTGKRLNLR